MRYAIHICALLGLCAVIYGANVGISNQISAKNTPSDVQIDKRKKEVDATFGGLRGAKNSKLRSSSDAQIALDGNKGGNVNAGRQNAVGTWSKSRSSTDAEVSVAGRKLTGEGDGKGSFDTTGGRGNKQHFTQTKSSKGQSEGTVELEHRSGKAAQANGEYNYQVDTPGNRGGHARFSDANSSPGRSSLKVDCNSPKVGETGCTNQAGKKTPTVVVDEDGHARLSKDGTSLARVNVEKSGRNEYTSSVEGKAARSSSPLYQTKVGDFTQTDCYREITKKNDPDPNDVKFIKKSLKFKYNSKNNRNTASYSFPDCFEVTAKIQLGKNINVKDLAVEFQARINPLGDLACADPATCGRGSCYYCDFCTDDAQKLDIIKNIDADKTCDTSTGNRARTYTLSATFCPPPNSDEFPVCTSFQRPYTSSFWTNAKEKSIVSRILIWERPAKTQDLSDRFFYCINGGSGCSIGVNFRTSLKVAYLAEQTSSNTGVSKDVPDEVLHDYYIRQQLGRTKDDYKEELKACERGDMDYDVAGTKTSGKFLIEMADGLRRKNFGISNAFVEAPCPEVQSVETQQYNSAMKAWKAGGSNRGSDGTLLSGLSSLGGSSSSSSSGGLAGLFSSFGG